MTIKMYGIKNCDTIKKARAFLYDQQIDFIFHDYRQDGLTAALLTEAAQQLGWQSLLNSRGTTWRGLSEQDKADVDAAKALQLMLKHPALIKRPLLDINGTFHLGFSQPQYQQLIQSL
jgi:Spx/MgsR family transcriptional regulator